MKEQVLNELNHLIAALEQPLPAGELANGWTSEAQGATLTFLRSIRDAAAEGRPLPEVRSAGRALDHWGVITGPLLEAACVLYNHINESRG